MFAHLLLYVEPLGLEYIAAGIKGIHNVKIADMVLEKGLSKILRDFQPDIVGCSVSTATVNTTKEVLSQVKAFNQKILTVVGGPHPTVQPQDLFHEDIDIVVVGEGVEVFKDICECFKRKKGYGQIRGIYHRHNGDILSTPEREFPDLDSFPFPDRSLTLQYRHKYGLLASGARPITIMRGSVGCSYGCTFCHVTSSLKGEVYTRSPHSIIEELATIEDETVYFIDDEFLLDPDRAVELARGIQEAGIRKTFGIFSRSDSIVKRPDTIEAWARIGLKYVMVGLESNREEDLRHFKKGTSISDNEEALRIMQRENVWGRVNYIVRPDFDSRDFKSMEGYVRNSRVELPFFSILTPFPGTKFYEDTKSQLITDNYDLWDVTHTVLSTKLPLKDFYRAYRGLILRSVSMGDKIKMLRQMDTKTRLELAINWLRMMRMLRVLAKHHD
jgi:radical SAM superfamily enzyme YgiQ (UPF0313 family)